MRWTRLLAIIALTAGLTASAPGLPEAGGLTEVRVQLKWSHQFQSAGFYAALDQGFFRDAGLDVTLLEGGPQIDPTERVLAGEADFGVATSGLLVTRSRGQPVVAVAAIFQHSPYILIARGDDDTVTELQDLEGRAVMVEPYAEELKAYLHHQGVDLAAVEVVPHSGDPLDLYRDEAVAMTAYTTTEPFILQQAGKPYRVFDPKLAGIDFYGDTLFTTAAFAGRHEEVVVAFREALEEGWRYALRHPGEVIDLIDGAYGSPLSREQLRAEAEEIRRLLIPDLIEIGYMNPARWEHIAGQLEAAGLLERAVDLDAFIFTPREGPEWLWPAVALGVSLLLVAGITGALAKYYGLARTLRAEIAARALLESELQQRAITDPGTGLLNRRGFFEAMRREVSRAQRRQAPLSLLAVDLDRFKRINDTWGHAVGDAALATVAAVCREGLREVDVIGRMGGEEFMIGLPDADPAGAEAVAERLRARVADTPIALAEGETLTITASVGVATRRHGEDLDSLMQRADEAMYAAKRAGRNRVMADAGVFGRPP